MRRFGENKNVMDQENLALRKFFQNFLSEEKNKHDISDEYLTLLKILWHCFDEIIIRNKTSRRIYLLEQIENFLTDDKFKCDIENVVLPNQEDLVNEQNLTISPIKIKEINLVNFRGFQSNDNGGGRNIEFNEKATLFFAPNGGGKSSLCEAIEWTLTGDSVERVKRKVDFNIYYQNTKKNSPSFKETKLVLTDSTIPLSSQIFDRCFLEKNRIEKFARIATQSNIEIREVLGELFGFSNIIDFFNEFGQYISPDGNEELNDQKRNNWNLWCNWTKKKKDLEKSIEDSKNSENLVKDELAKLTDNKNFEEREKDLLELKSKSSIELDNLQKDFSNIFSYQEFKDKVSLFLEKINRVEVLDKNISENAKDLNFEGLFQAANIIFTSDYSDDKCPLCDTPFSEDNHRMKVVTDPRQKTKTELKKLKTLTDWKTEKTKTENELKEEDFIEIRNLWQKIQHNLIEDNWSKINGDDTKPSTPEIDFDDLEKSKKEGVSLFLKKSKDAFKVDLSSFSDIENMVLTYRAKRDEKLKLKPSKESEIGEIDKKLKDLRDKYNNFVANQKIRSKYESDLENLNDQSGNSQTFQKIIDSYPIFYKSFENFQSESILKESAAVDEFITGFYRSQNLHDHESERIKSISFPKNISEEFCIVYEKDESKTCNALSILSEGHLKTLGLAALLSRAMKFNAPILVFDDAINAIDSDHRDNLSLLLSGNLKTEDGGDCFGDKWQTVKNFINDCQLVITSHDRFFDEKMANLLPADKQKRYVLYSGEKGIDFCEKGIPANFEAKIDYFLKPEVQDIRSAIFYCRIWLEEILLAKVMYFKKPGNNKPITFENSIDRKTKQSKNPELITIITSLINNLKNSSIQDEKDIATILEEISNDKDTKYPWFFEILNQESHYRRFDHIDISNAPPSQEVRRVFDKIKSIYILSQQSVA